MNGCGGEQSYGFVQTKKNYLVFKMPFDFWIYIGMVIKENAEHIN